MSAPQRILIVRLGAMGDILHAMPAVVALRKAFPGSNFGWVVEKRWAELLREAEESPRGDGSGPVDFVHVVDTRKWRRSLFSGSTRSETRHVLNSIRKIKYDLVIDFQGAVKSAVIAKLTEVPRRFGFAKPWEWPAAIAYTDKATTASIHVVDQNLDLASATAREFKQEALDRDASVGLPHDSSAEAKVCQRLTSFGMSRFAILNPGAGWGAKQWPPDRYAAVARALGKDGVRSLINLGPGEESLAKTVEDQAEGYAIAAQFTISELIAVTRRASLFIGGDTGPLHLAAVLKIPVVALFGPTDPARTGPYGTRSIVLRDPSSITSHKRNRQTEPGLMNITPEQVIAAAHELLVQGARA